MSEHRARDRITLAPLTSKWSSLAGLPPATMTQITPVALIVGVGSIPEAVLVRHSRTGILSAYCGGVLKSVPQSKAKAALAALGVDP